MLMISGISAVLSYGMSSDSSFAIVDTTISGKDLLLADDVHNNTLLRSPQVSNNTHVPDHAVPYISDEVGQIDIVSGVTPTGAKTYTIPITAYPGVNGFGPNLSLEYNSQRGNSVAGTGWAISGLSVISRSNQNFYYDSRARGIAMDADDAFLLDGVRLIRTGSTSDNIIYETEHGNIKARAWLAGNVVKYFEVYYPDGREGVFGPTTNTGNRLCYPVTTLTDLHGNRIDYSYTFTNGCYNINKVSYGGASVEFKYQQTTPDPMRFYSGGQCFYESKRLVRIICRIGTTSIGEYSFGYSIHNRRTLLDMIWYKSGGKVYSPIRLYYGTGNNKNTFTTGTTISVTSAYHLEVGDGIRTINGAFGYDGKTDGLAILPNKNPYYLHHRDSEIFSHSQDRFLNLYSNRDNILIYTGLHGTNVSSTLLAEDGFVDLLAADLDGNCKDYLVRINNTAVGNDDRVTFHVYSTVSHTKPIAKYIRTFNFQTVSTDADGGKSIHPKFYYTGDFNGDGKAEIMAVSAHQPFGDKGKPSKCYIFDLLNGSVLFQDHVFPYSVEFTGTRQSDAGAAANNTDKLLVIDYDGDGKSDICHIGENEISIYTFDVDGDRYTARKVASRYILNKAGVADRYILSGDFNGDGLTDLLVSPHSKSNVDTDWAMYNSKGDGTFDKSTFTGPAAPNKPYTGFVTQDVDGDEIADLIKYDDTSASAFLIKGNKSGERILVCSYTQPSLFVPVKNSYDCYTKLIKISDAGIELFGISRHDLKESLLTGVVGSLGNIEKNYYFFIGETDEYAEGSDAVFPYLNISGRLPVVTHSHTYINRELFAANRYTYTNAVFHRHGLGFRGFEEIRSIIEGKEFFWTYQPYNHCLLAGERSQIGEKTYTYSVDIQPNKIARIRLKEKAEEDYLKEFSSHSVFTYDPYGYPTSEHTSYSDGTEVTKSYTYANNPTMGNGYHLGFLTDNSVTTTRDGMTYTERMHIPSHASRMPKTRIYYKDGNRVKREDYEYDSSGNPLTVSLQHYSSAVRLSTRYEYDTYGRVTKETNAMGHTRELPTTRQESSLPRRTTRGLSPPTVTTPWDARRALYAPTARAPTSGIHGPCQTTGPCTASPARQQDGPKLHLFTTRRTMK